MRYRFQLASVAAVAVAVLAVVATSALALAETQSNPEALPELDAPYMLRGYFHAGSPVRDSEALGGFGSSGNLPVRLDRDAAANAVSLVALPEEHLAFGEHRGFRVILVNTAGEPVAFNASDSRLSIVREAVDAKGKWQPVEYLPSSWCGNSYHRVFLPSGQYWSFSAPVYSGDVETRMRFVLWPAGTDKPIYSNEFSGSVNAEQFSIREGHEPMGIMDPYNE